MKIQTLPLLALLTALPAWAGAIPERIETALQERIAAGLLPSAVVAMVDGDEVQVEGFGGADGGTLYEIGSVTKTFTATLLAEDVELGRLKLDQPVQSLLPGFSLTSYQGRKITLADIAEQRSGLPRMPGNFHPGNPADPYADYDASLMKEFLASYKLLRAPGETYEYSNLAVGLLGYALATKQHQSYGDLVAARILKPLGMTSSGVALTPIAGVDANGKPSGSWRFDALAGAGAIKSSGDDMLRYLKAYMGRTATPLRAAMDLAIAPRREVAAGQTIGLIWMTAKDENHAVTWHNGLTGGYASFIGFTADKKRGVVILVNQAQPVDDLGFAALLDDRPLAPARKAIDLPADQLDAYEGTYRLRDKFFISVMKGGDQLYSRATGQAMFPLFAKAPDQFFAKIADISLDFQRDGQGKVTSMLLHQDKDYPCPKVSDPEAAAELGAIDLDRKTLQSYAGQYRLPPGQIFEITEAGGQLRARLGEQSAIALFPRSRTAFFYLAVDADLEFQRDPADKVTGLILHQGGRDLPATRVEPQ